MKWKEYYADPNTKKDQVDAVDTDTGRKLNVKVWRCWVPRKEFDMRAQYQVGGYVESESRLQDRGVRQDCVEETRNPSDGAVQD